MDFILLFQTPPMKVVNSTTDYSTNVPSLKYYCQFIILLHLKRNVIIIMKITTCVWTKQFTINYHFIKGFIRNKRKKWIVISFKRLKIFIMIRKKYFSMTLKLKFDVRGNILFAFLSNKTLIMMMTIILEDSYLLCALEF